jgi:pyrimidine operon attenuation protein/uracil phosphoribosyltransferase
MSDWEMTGRELDRSVARLAREITERLGDPGGFALVGIVTGGQVLARLLANAIEANESIRPMTGSLDITLYRDDLYTGLEKPELGETRLPFRVGGTAVVLVDDVLFTGRTVRAALDELWDYGRPRWIKLVLLVDSGHRELPIAADFVGRELTTEQADRVVVQFEPDLRGQRGVRVVRGGAKP